MIDVVHLIDELTDYLNENIDSDVTTIASLKAEGADKAIIQAGLYDWKRACSLVGQLAHFRALVIDERHERDDALEVAKNAH